MYKTRSTTAAEPSSRFGSSGLAGFSTNSNGTPKHCAERASGVRPIDRRNNLWVKAAQATGGIVAYFGINIAAGIRPPQPMAFGPRGFSPARSSPDCRAVGAALSSDAYPGPLFQRAAAKMFRKVLRYATSDGVPRRSLVVALVVGTILNLINQGDAMLVGRPLDLLKLSLTYLVPYLVSTYGAVSYRLHTATQADGEPAPTR